MQCHLNRLNLAAEPNQLQLLEALKCAQVAELNDDPWFEARVRDLAISIDGECVDEETHSGNSVGLTAREVLAQHLDHVL